MYKYYFDNNNGQMLFMRVDENEEVTITEVTFEEYINILAFYDQERIVRETFLNKYFKGNEMSIEEQKELELLQAERYERVMPVKESEE